MTKYNMAEIMTTAWATFRKLNSGYGTDRNGKKIIRWDFAFCLRKAWADAKEAARVFTGLIRNVQVAGTACHPILVNVDMDDLTVTGNTFPVRQLMHDLGLAWDGIRKAWTGSRETLNALCVKYA